MTGPGLRTPDVERLEAVLERLVAAGRLSADQAVEVRTDYADAAPATLPPTERGAAAWRAVLPEVGGYVGGAFVVAAVLVLLGPRWDSLTAALQVSLLLGPGLLLVLAAGALSVTTPGGWRPRAAGNPSPRRRVVAVFLVVAAVLVAGAAAVIAGPDLADRVMSATATVLLIGAYAWCPAVLTQLALLLSAVLTVGTWTAWAAHQLTATENPSVAIGVALTVLAGGWLAGSVGGLVAERAVGVFGGCAVAFLAAEILAVGGESTAAAVAGYLLLAVLAAGGLVGYVRTRLIGLLVVGVVALAVVVPQAVLDLTDGAIGAGGALLLVGMSVIGASVLGFRLRRGGSPG